MAGKYDASIDRGMAFLDVHVPGWVDRIDLGRLNLENCHVCVIGQLIGDASNEYFGLVALIADRDDQDGERWPPELGFNLPTDDDGRWIGSYPALARAWKRAIRARRAETAAARPTAGAQADGEET